MKLELGLAIYQPLKGASYIPLPKRVRDKKAVLNIQNQDQKCFVWSVLAALHPVHRRDQPHRVRHYLRYEHEFNVQGIEFPVKIGHIPKFERQNPEVSVNVFGYEDQELFPLYITKQKKQAHINVLLFSQDSQRHYCLIRDLDRLLHSMTNYNGQKYHCNCCS